MQPTVHQHSCNDSKLSYTDQKQSGRIEANLQGSHQAEGLDETVISIIQF